MQMIEPYNLNNYKLAKTFQVGVYLDKPFLKNILRLCILFGITQTNGHHPAGIPVEQSPLTLRIPTQASLDQFSFRQTMLSSLSSKNTPIFRTAKEEDRCLMVENNVNTSRFIHFAHKSALLTGIWTTSVTITGVPSDQLSTLVKTGK